MRSFSQTLEELNDKLGLSLPPELAGLDEVTLARTFLSHFNEYLYQTHDGIGCAQFNDTPYQYFSDFHVYWEAKHKEILNLKIDRVQARRVAGLIRDAAAKHGDAILKVQHDTLGLPASAVAQTRFFTANQDFRRPPKAQFELYLADPGQFDAASISADPESLLKFLKMSRLSQNDKRISFAKNAADFLLDRDTNAAGIAAHYGNDAKQIQEALSTDKHMGYALKKTNMLIRDMVDLGVWTGLKNLDCVDVASDINTMKLALRTRILTSEIPLLSSFLDIFCSQYGHVDETSAAAWRAVWEIWAEEDPDHAPVAPCGMDYLLYRMGREHCRETLVRYECENGHAFYWFGARLRRCRVCSGTKAYATPGARILPCQANHGELPREEGQLALPADDLLAIFEGRCIFSDACGPTEDSFVMLDPPKSISVLGETGWTTAYAYRGRGGGGLMS